MARTGPEAAGFKSLPPPLDCEGVSASRRRGANVRRAPAVERRELNRAQRRCEPPPYPTWKEGARNATQPTSPHRHRRRAARGPGPAHRRGRSGGQRARREVQRTLADPVRDRHRRQPAPVPRRNPSARQRQGHYRPAARRLPEGHRLPAGLRRPVCARKRQGRVPGQSADGHRGRRGPRVRVRSGRARRRPDRLRLQPDRGQDPRHERRGRQPPPQPGRGQPARERHQADSGRRHGRRLGVHELVVHGVRDQADRDRALRVGHRIEPGHALDPAAGERGHVDHADACRHRPRLRRRLRHRGRRQRRVRGRHGPGRDRAELWSVDLATGRTRSLGRIGRSDATITGLAAWQDG